MTKSVYIIYVNCQAKPNLGLIHRYTSDSKLFTGPISSKDFIVDDNKLSLVKSIDTVDKVVINIIKYVAFMDLNFGRGALYIKYMNSDEMILVDGGMEQLKNAVSSVYDSTITTVM